MQKERKNECGNTGMEKMTDEELSKRLGQYQRTENIWFFVAVCGVIAGIVIAFATYNIIFASVLIFAGAGAAVVFGGSANKKKKQLMQQQLGSFFKDELEKAFGTEFRSDEMRIDETYMKNSHLVDCVWENYETANFREGKYCGIRFSAANVVLNHVYEKRVPHEGKTVCSDTMFKGIVLRCKTNVPTQTSVTISKRDGEEPCGDISDVNIFNLRFTVKTEPTQTVDTLITSEFCKLLKETENSAVGKFRGMVWSGDTLSLAFDTVWKFASVSEHIDARNIDEIRNWYKATLRNVEHTLDTLKKSRYFFVTE